MSLQKQNISIPFSQGLDTKTDPFQVAPGKFLSLVNSVFDEAGLLKKRLGFPLVTSIPNTTTLSTYNNSLVAIGTNLNVYSADNNQVIDSGKIVPINISTQSLVRRATSQTTVDVAVEINGLALSTWLDSDGNSYYQISDSITSQTIVPAVQLPATATMSRAYVLGRYFIITYLATVSAAPHLQYIAIPIVDVTSPLSPVDIATSVGSISIAYDGTISNNNLYISWNANDGGGAVRTRFLTSTLVFSNPVVISGQVADLISLCADTSGSSPVIWVSFYRLSTNTIKVVAYSASLVVILSTTTAVSSITINEITSAAINNVLTLYYEVANTYSYAPNVKTDYIAKNTVTIAGVVGSPSIILRGVGIASKAINYLGNQYLISTYGQAYQPTYFAIDGNGNIVVKIAYSNGGGYLANQVLAGININNGSFQVGYLFKDLLAAVNKTQGVTNINGVYSQTGINLVTFLLNDFVNTSEIGKNLHISGGFMWMYDGVKAVEHGFHVWPEDITAVPHTSGGSMSDDTYFYQVTYEWTDNQGNIHRSAPSVPVTAVVSGGSGSGSVTVNIPNLRLTYKIHNKVRIVIYRWSISQPSYYRITNITSTSGTNPLILNDPTADSVAFVDKLNDTSILGNDLIYTTGSVIEDIAAPASSAQALFKSRVFLVDSEDRNLLWYSKQVIEGVPVEFSDLFTIYVPPASGARVETGTITALSPMDDKLIIFKQNAIYYITGNGPDNTGSNNDFSDPIFVASTVGCANPDSVVLMPHGLMFQSDKGIWLLGRDLSTQYIGAPVEEFNDQDVQSAVAIPGTNQVRFVLPDNMLMYDYYYGQWGTFSVSGISSVIFQGKHTCVDSIGQIIKESTNSYLDISNPVLMSFVSSWFNLAGLQGYQRAFFFYVLGRYLSPHKMYFQIAYDYNSSPIQSVLITPDNFSSPSPSSFGIPTPFGSSGDIEQWRIFFKKQRCQSFQVQFNEVFDASLGVAPGAGLTLSGLNAVVSIKKSWIPISAANSSG